MNNNRISNIDFRSDDLSSTQGSTTSASSQSYISQATEKELDDERNISVYHQALTEQEKLYRNGSQEDFCFDTEKCIQRYLKKIFRQVKFFSDLKEDFKCPNFVCDNKEEEQQTVQICNWLLSHMGKDEYESDEKIMFWKTYWKFIYKEISKMRMGDTNAFKNRFIKGEFKLFFDI